MYDGEQGIVLLNGARAPRAPATVFALSCATNACNQNSVQETQISINHCGGSNHRSSTPEAATDHHQKQARCIPSRIATSVQQVTHDQMGLRSTESCTGHHCPRALDVTGAGIPLLWSASFAYPEHTFCPCPSLTDVCHGRLSIVGSMCAFSPNEWRMARG